MQTSQQLFAPGFEWFIIVLGLLLLIGGVIASIIASRKASTARLSKTGAVKAKRKQDAFHYYMYGIPCILVGLMFFLPFVFSVGWIVAIVVAVLAVGYGVSFAVLYKRYHAAGIDSEKASQFDRMMWEMINGEEIG